MWCLPDEPMEGRITAENFCAVEAAFGYSMPDRREVKVLRSWKRQLCDRESQLDVLARNVAHTREAGRRLMYYNDLHRSPSAPLRAATAGGGQDPMRVSFWAASFALQDFERSTPGAASTLSTASAKRSGLNAKGAAATPAFASSSSSTAPAYAASLGHPSATTTTASAAASAVEPPLDADEREMSLMNVTLMDTKDTPEMLQKRALELQASQGPTLQKQGVTRSSAAECARSQNRMWSKRTLAVVQRKYELLKDLKARTAAYEHAVGRRAELLAGAFAGARAPSITPTQLAYGFGPFLKGVVQDGNPQEIDKSNFAYLVRTFCLTPQHEMVLQAQRTLRGGIEELCRYASHKVAELTLPYGGAADKAGPTPLWDLAQAYSRVMSLLQALSVPIRHEVMQELRQSTDCMRATYVLRIAQEAEKESSQEDQNTGPKMRGIAGRIRQSVDEAMQLGVDNSSVELLKAIAIADRLQAMSVLLNARRASELASCGPTRAVAASAAHILEECQAATALGVPTTDSLLAEAQAIAHDLRAGMTLRNALAAKEKDHRSYSMRQYRSGNATAMAGRIEQEIREAVAASTPESHESLVQAQKLAKELREQETIRKSRRYRDAQLRKTGSLCNGSDSDELEGGSFVCEAEEGAAEERVASGGDGSGERAALGSTPDAVALATTSSSSRPGTGCSGGCAHAT